MYKVVIFDMDGTILDTLQDLANATNFVLQKNAFPNRTIDEVRQFVGNGIPKLLERACPKNTDDAKLQAIFKQFTDYYEIHCAENTKPYNGIIELLQKLKTSGIKTAVNSNKIDFAVHELCDKYFPNLFDFQFGSVPTRKNKPSPDAVNEIIQTAKIAKADAVYIGDSDVDLQTAINSDVDFIGAEWGFRSKEFLIEHGAKVTAKNTTELEKLLFEI